MIMTSGDDQAWGILVVMREVVVKVVKLMQSSEGMPLLISLFAVTFLFQQPGSKEQRVA
jgi:hypothetical protein